MSVLLIMTVMVSVYTAFECWVAGIYIRGTWSDINLDMERHPEWFEEMV